MERLAEMTGRFHTEWEFAAKLPADLPTCRDYYTRFLASPDTRAFVATDAGRVIGTFGLVIMSHPFAVARIGMKSFWYAEPEFPGVGRELLRLAEIIAKVEGCAQFFVASMHPRVNKLLLKEGFAEQERCYFKDL